MTYSSFGDDADQPRIIDPLDVNEQYAPTPIYLRRTPEAPPFSRPSSNRATGQAVGSTQFSIWPNGRNVANTIKSLRDTLPT